MSKRATRGMARPVAVCLRLATLLAIGITLTAANAFAGAAGKDPLSLVLQRSDMPAKATYVNGRLPTVEKGLAGVGITGAAAFHHSNLQRSATSTDMVSGLVVVLRSTADTRRVYRLFKDDLAPKPGSVVPLPAYGDEQVAWWTQSIGKAGLLVRKGSLVWQLEVDPDRLTKSQTLAQLKAYAVKQKRRVGAG
jgi:hypothetical protein